MSAVLKRNYREIELYPVREEGKPMAETGIHVNQIFELINILRTFFDGKQVAILADMTFYYEENNPKKWIAPDVFVTKDVPPNTERRVFRLWEERPPDVVFEISSRSTWGEDLNRKWKIYEQIGVKEYYIFDPEYDYLTEPLVAYRLNLKGELNKIKVKKNRIFSPALGLDIVDTGKGLRLFNPATQQFLPTSMETQNAFRQAEIERNAALSAQQQAEAEIARLKAEIEKLKQNSQ